MPDEEIWPGYLENHEHSMRLQILPRADSAHYSMRLRGQIFAGYILIAMLVVVVGLTGYIGLSAIAQSFDSAVNRTQPVLTSLNRIQLAATTLAFSVAAQSKQDPVAPPETTPSKKHSISLAEITTAVAEYRVLIEKYFPNELATAREIDEAAKVFENAVVAMNADGISRDDRAFHAQMAKVSAALIFLQDQIAEAAASEEREFHEHQENVQSSLMNHLVLLCTAIGGSLFIAIGGGAWLAMRMTKPVAALCQAAQRMGAGNLESRAEVYGMDEIGELALAFNQMGNDLSRTLVGRDYLETIIDSLSEGVMVVDQTGRILRSNVAMQRICSDVATERTLGRTLEEVFVNDAILGSLQDDVQTQCTFESTLRMQTNPAVIVSVTVSPLIAGKSIGERVIVTRDITEKKQMEEQVRQLAYYDRLTKLPNRHMLDDRLSRAMAASKRSGSYGALMFLDLDNFKTLNDTHGHDTGDLLLIEVARRLTNSVRQVDTAARFGGDEFVVMLEELDSDKSKATSQAQAIAEKIRVALTQPYLLQLTDEGQTECTVEHSCTASIGVVLFVNHQATQENILKWADIAMYQAKNCGTNTIRFYESNSQP